MSKPDKWMPLYIADYLAATTRLSTEQHGAYLLLLMDYWRNGPPPDEDETLAAITGLPLPRWKQQRPFLLRFFTIEAGTWRQKRADKELGEWAAYVQQKSNAGKASAEAKAQRKANARSTPVATDVQQNAQPSPSPSSLRSEDPPSPPQAGGSDASQGSGKEPDRRSPRAKGENPRATAKAREEAKQREEAAAFAEARRAKWSPRLAEYRDTGLWQTAWGSEPWTGNSGCLVPPDMREAFTAIWRARQDAFALPDNLRRADQPVDEAAAIDAHYREITARRTA